MALIGLPSAGYIVDTPSFGSQAHERYRYLTMIRPENILTRRNVPYFTWACASVVSIIYDAGYLLLLDYTTMIVKLFLAAAIMIPLACHPINNKTGRSRYHSARPVLLSRLSYRSVNCKWLAQLPPDSPLLPERTALSPAPSSSQIRPRRSHDRRPSAKSGSHR